MSERSVTIRGGRPAICVKDYTSTEDVRQGPEGEEYEDGFWRWIAAESERDPARFDWAWQAACEQGWEELQGLAAEVFGAEAKVYSEGRSGGWAVLHGIGDPWNWDRRDYSRWRRFTTMVGPLIPGYVARTMVDLIYFNAYEPLAAGGPGERCCLNCRAPIPAGAGAGSA